MDMHTRHGRAELRSVDPAEGWPSPGTVLDLFNREIVGWLL
jgi:hypothetical protein